MRNREEVSEEENTGEEGRRVSEEENTCEGGRGNR